jgi:alpha-soluble NSF attachment protein
MADGQEQKAIELMSQADRKLKSAGGFFGSFFGGSSKTEEAAELYTKAANAFKMAKKWAAAGGAFCRAAEMNLKGSTKHEAATNYVDASTCYKKADPAEAIHCLLKAIEIYTDMGRFTIAAKHHMTIAEIYETDMIDIDKSMANYELAADYYKGEESNSAANKCLLKVAQYAAQVEQYPKAIEIYEQVAAMAINSPLLRYGAKDHYFRAVLCRMCQDVQDASNAITKYEEQFPAFADSRECKLLKSLIAACNDQNVDGFTDAIRDYDSISRLDQWYTSILLRIKKTIEGDGSLL